MASNLFAHLNFLIIDDKNENKDSVKEISDIIKKSGCGSICTYSVTGNEASDFEGSKKWFIQNYDTKDIHFIVSNNVDFPFYKVAAFDYLIPVVSTLWIKECVERKHLLRTLNFSPDPRHILKDTTIYIARDPTMSNADHRFYSEIITSLGGICVDVLSYKITHLVATSSSNSTIIDFCQGIKNLESSNNNINVKIVYPTWLIHCFKAQEFINENNHIIKVNSMVAGSSQSNLNSDERFEDLWDEVNSMSMKPPQLHYLQNHKFIVDLELSLSSHLYNFLIQLIKLYGGSFLSYIDLKTITTNDEIDCFIGGSANSKGFETCKKKGLNTGNIIWFFNLWSLQSFVPPQRKIIWSPFKHKIFKSKDLIVSHTNYFGQERVYIQKLTGILGGSTTTSLSSMNTHLLVKFPHGKKLANAMTKKPNCRVVNHLWLEKCYDNGKILDASLDEFKDYDIGKKTLSNFLNQIGKTEDIVKVSNTSANISIQPDDKLPGNISSDDETDIGFSTANEDDTTIPNIDKSITESNSSVLASTQIIEAAKQPSVQLCANNEELEVNLPVLKNEKQEESNEEEITSTKSKLEESKPDGKPSQTAKSTKDDLKEYEELFGDISQTSDISNTNTMNNDTPNTPAASRQASTAYMSKKSPVRQISNETSNLNEIHKVTPKEEPLTPPISNSVELNSDPTVSRRRAARAKAEKRLHEDIESLNEFEKNRKKKRIGDLLPTEIKRLEHVKEIKKQAKDTVLQLKNLPSAENEDEIFKQLKRSYNIKAYVTGCHDELSELSIEILALFGVQISNEYHNHLNSVIAPRRIRTVKFLNALSFHPLEYVLSPDFITHFMKNIDSKNNPVDNVNAELYTINDITDEVLKKTKLNNKLFERAFISNINIAIDVSGSVDTVSSILMNHGIKEVQKLSQKPYLVNNHSHKKISLRNGRIIHPPKCIILSGNKQSLRKWKKEWKEQNNGDGEGLLIVNWDWCVENIFQLDVDYNEKENVLFSSL